MSEEKTPAKEAKAEAPAEKVEAKAEAPTEKVEAAAEAATEEVAETPASTDLKLDGLYAFKVGMSSVYSEAGKNIPVTVLKYEPWFVSQVKTQEKDGYEAVQIACRPKKSKNTLASEKGHLKDTPFENGASLVREIRQSSEGVSVGTPVSLSSLEKGQSVKVSGVTKGRGFAGVMKRYGFGGGPASHGSGFHRRPGSMGNCTFPGRIMPGKKMPGHYGAVKKTTKNVQIVDVIENENVILVKGPVPGSRNSMVQLVRA